MTHLRVDTAAGLLHAFGRTLPCAIGRNGACPAEAKREGDGMTPLGQWPIRTLLLRPDRVTTPLSRPVGVERSRGTRDAGAHVSTSLDTNGVVGLSIPWRWLRPDDGWSDDPADSAYNRPVRHPHPFSAERMWREDGLYDAILILGHNDAPAVPGAGSAIFLHCWNEAKPTEGCVAVERGALVAMLPLLRVGDVVEVT